MISGKLIGGLIGLFTSGFFGAIIGVLVGHFFDRGFGRALGFDYGADRARLQRLFFETTFTIMGHLAKADGRVTEEEISQAENLMVRLGLTPEHRREAIALFKQGCEKDFSLEPVISKFISEGGRQHNLPILLLEFLFSIAMADGVLHDSERDILARTAGYLGINGRQFEQLLSMLMAQENFQGNAGGSYQRTASSINEVESAYQALGVSSSATDGEIKKAYRKLMSQHHPDKLIAKGVPEDMVKMATEKSQSIQAAYELIKSVRGK